MPNSPLFPQKYPGTGKFVVLCEGDLSGYEVAILGKWLRERVPTRHLVDVRPCGTREAMLGAADAIGRSVRVIIVEDRDFRTRERASSDCEKAVAEREKRGLSMRGWIAWSRNEIENYFLDDEVLFPAMREAFGCNNDDAKAARDEAVSAIRLFQVVQAAVSETDIAWAELMQSRRVGGGLPKWTDRGLTGATATEIRANLEKHLAVMRAKFYDEEGLREPLSGGGLLRVFDERLHAWTNGELPVATWKSDWAGKETLKLVRQLLAAKFSPPVLSRNERVAAVDWGAIRGRELQNALDRDIERAIQPVLIDHLWSHLNAVANADMNGDFERISQAFRL